MCGIAGILDRRGRAVAPEVARAFWEAIEHRGPDDRGWAAESPVGSEGSRGAMAGVAGVGGVAGPASTTMAAGVDLPPGGPPPAECLLLHRRLSILDLTEAGRQPMSDPSGRVVVVLNGEVYNYRELRAELEAEGCAFRSTSDTEALAAGLARWGASLLPRLVGMFAFAAWDRASRRLLLARDPFGIKPLYLAEGDGRLAFASEITALLRLPWIGRGIDPQSAWEYLRLGRTDAGERTFFDSVRQLPAGCYLELLPDAPNPPRPVLYATPGESAAGTAAGRPNRGFDAAVKEVRRLFLESVELHLRSDVPVGTTLSGGVDSSAVIAAMRHILGPRGEIHAFSYVPDDPALSEERWIDLVSAATGAVSHKVRPGAFDLRRELRELVRTQDQPFQSTSIFAQSRVFRLVQESGLKVVLDGQGADEVFGGYGVHVAARLRGLLRRGDLVGAARLWSGTKRRPGMGVGLGPRALGPLLPGFLAPVARRFSGREAMPDWLAGPWFADRGVEVGFPAGRQVSVRDALRESREETILPALLRYEDRNSMRYAVEGRVPFLEPALVAFTTTLPDEYFVGPDGETKRILRAALRGLVPDPVLDRRDKLGFATPESRWLRELDPWVRETLAGERIRALPFLRPDRLEARWELSRASGARDPVPWRFLNLVEWADAFDVTV